MSKRKQNRAEDDGDESDVSLVDVDFEFFDPNPDIDYHALKRLSAQLFQADAEALQTQDLAELILSQPLVGTTVKCDGKESDPYAFLTVLNMHVHQTRPCIKSIADYVISKSASNPALQSSLQNLLGPEGDKGDKHLGFIFSERLINMPPQVVPPMYRMLGNEIQWAIDDNEPYRFSHLLFISRTYRLTAEEAQDLQAKAPKKRQKVAQVTVGGGVFSFHPEDEYIHKFASHVADYSFSASQPREQDAFGLDMGGRMMLVPAERLPQLISTLHDAFAPP